MQMTMRRHTNTCFFFINLSTTTLDFLHPNFRLHIATVAKITVTSSGFPPGTKTKKRFKFRDFPQLHLKIYNNTVQRNVFFI